jgi:MtaA/CmuA family methyltransferase
MDKKQKFKNLIKGENLDKFKFFRPILMHFAARFNKTTYDVFASDYKVLVESNIRSMEYFNTDMVSLISDPYRETSAFGAEIYFPKDAVPRCKAPIIQNFDDVHQLKKPDIYKNLRTLDRIKGARLYDQLLKGKVPVSGWVEGPLAEACDLAGVSNMLMQLMVDPDFCNLLLDKCLDTAKDFAQAQVLEGCDLIGIGDSICSQIDKETYDLFVKERHKELIGFIHETGSIVKLHICGDITHLLPSLKDLCADIIDLDWQVDMNHAFEVLGEGVVRGGNLNPVDIESKSRQEVFEMSKSLVRNEKGRRHLFAAGCEITVNTPIENLMAMREASL